MARDTTRDMTTGATTSWQLQAQLWLGSFLDELHCGYSETSLQLRCAPYAIRTARTLICIIDSICFLRSAESARS